MHRNRLSYLKSGLKLQVGKNWEETGALTSGAEEGRGRFQDQGCRSSNDFGAVLLSDKAFQQYTHLSMPKLKDLTPKEDAHGGAFRHKSTNLL